MSTREYKIETYSTKCAMAKAFHNYVVCGGANSSKVVYSPPERSACTRVSSVKDICVFEFD